MMCLASYGVLLRENVTGALSNLSVCGFPAAVDVRDDFGSLEQPNVTIEASIFFGGVEHDIAFEEGEDCDDEEPYPEPDCNDDMGFDEVKWFMEGDGDIGFE